MKGKTKGHRRAYEWKGLFYLCLLPVVVNAIEAEQPVTNDTVISYFRVREWPPLQGLGDILIGKCKHTAAAVQPEVNDNCQFKLRRRKPFQAPTCCALPIVLPRTPSMLPFLNRNDDLPS